MVKSKKLTKADCNRLKHMVKHNTAIDKKHMEQGKALIRHAKYGNQENKRITKKIAKNCK